MKQNRGQSASAKPNLAQRKGRLLEQLSESAKTYLELTEKLAAAPPESEACGALEGTLYARINQLRFDAEDVIEVMDGEVERGEIEGLEAT